MVRLAAYGGISCLLAGYVVLSAFRQRTNFFSAAVYLSKSNACMMILWNLGVFLTILFGRGLQSIFFGPLRLLEIERLHERAWYAVTESLLALTIFREAFDTAFVILFVSLLFLKVFHWLAGDRVEMMEQSPNINRLFHIRMVTVLSTLWFFDIALIALAAESILVEGPSVMIMFASEYMIMLATLLSTTLKYAVNVYDLRSEIPWDNKSVFVFYIDLACDFLKLSTYLCFFSLILTFYGLPLNILRDVYITFRSFVVKIRDLARYRQATRNMDERYPNATPEEMERMSDKTCIICREEMEARPPTQPAAGAQQGNNQAVAINGGGRQGPNDTPKKLPCGHVFHFHCLRSWLERQQSCPTCRRPVLSTPVAGSQQLAQPGQVRAAGQPAAPQPGQAPRLPNTTTARPGPSGAPPATSTRTSGSHAREGHRVRRAGIDNPLVAFQSPSTRSPVTTPHPTQPPEPQSTQVPFPPTSMHHAPPGPSPPNNDREVVPVPPVAPAASMAASDERATLRQRLEAAARFRQGLSNRPSPTPSPGPVPPLSSSADGQPPPTPTITVKPSSPISKNISLAAASNIPLPHSAPVTPKPSVSNEEHNNPFTTFTSSTQPHGVQPSLSFLPSGSGTRDTTALSGAYPSMPSAHISHSPDSRAPLPGTSSANGDYPRLIPLFDPVNPGRPAMLSSFFPQMRQSNAMHAIMANLPQGADAPTSFTGLPENLTAGQLASLAEITKDGLETRMKLLQNTEQTIRACMKQMQEAMSLLSTGDLSSALQVASEVNGMTEDAFVDASPDSSAKGKGRADTPISQPS